MLRQRNGASEFVAGPGWREPGSAAADLLQRQRFSRAIGYAANQGGTMASGPTRFLQTRTPSAAELAADGAIHVLGLCLGLPAAIAAVAAAAGAPGQLAPVALYAAGLAAMFGCSAAYHLLRAS